MKWILLSIVVTATALSDLLQSHEMKRAGEQSVGARGLARLLKTIAKRRYLILSIVCLAISFFAFMALVQANRSASPCRPRRPASSWRRCWRSSF
jgi:hypothetical protein